MYEAKTKPTKVSVASYLQKVADPQQRADARQILKIMKEITGKTPKMWGPSMIGFGDYHYVYPTGHEGDCFLTGFAPRKGYLALYFLSGLQQRFPTHLKKLGKHKTGKGCLYIKKLADVDLDVLRDMIKLNFDHFKIPTTCDRL